MLCVGSLFILMGEVYLYLFNIHTFIHTICFVLWGGVSVGWCALFVFGHKHVA